MLRPYHHSNPTVAASARGFGRVIVTFMGNEAAEATDEPGFEWDTTGVDQRFIGGIVRRRLDRGMSLTEFARRAREEYGLPFHPATVVRIEKGERPLKLHEAAILAQMLGTDVAELLSDNQEAEIEARLRSTSAHAFDSLVSANQQLRRTHTELVGVGTSLNRAIASYAASDALRDHAVELLAELRSLCVALEPHTSAFRLPAAEVTEWTGRPQSQADG